MARNAASSSGAASVTAVPAVSARPVRPTRGRRLYALRHLVVYDVTDAFDVDAAGRDVGGHQRPEPARLEALDGGRALALRPIGMQRRALDAALREPARQLVGARLVRTNTRLVPCVRLRKPLSQSAFSAAGTRCPTCSMVLASPSSRPTRIIFGARMIWLADFATSSDIVAENSSVCLSPATTPRCAARSARTPCPACDRPRRERARRGFEFRRVRAHVIEQTAWRRHDDIGRAAKAAFLWTRFDAAIHRDARKTRVVRQPLKLVLYLHGKLSRRRKNQHARGACCSGF